MTTTFNTETNKQIRELTADELEAVAGGMPPAVAAFLLGMAANAAYGILTSPSTYSAIDWQGAAARGHW